MRKKIFHSAPLLAIVPILFLFIGCASTNPAVVLWKHGFSKETGNNPIALGSDIVWHENQITGFAANTKGKNFWFTADLETKQVEIFPIIDKDGTDHTEIVVRQLKENVAQGGEVLENSSGMPERLMAMLDWTWERQTIGGSITGSRLGASSANLSEFDPENPKNDTSLMLKDTTRRVGD